MDLERFDRLTRAVSGLLSRRTLAGALGLGALTLPGLADAKNKKRKKKRKRTCKGSTRRCGKRCIPKTQCCKASDCGANGVCSNGLCNCAVGYVPCGNTCTAEGACCTDADCPAQRCCDGVCAECCIDVNCQPGQICAAGSCVAGAADCAADADSCAAFGVIFCADSLDCFCNQRLEGGVRCVQFTSPLAACDQCRVDADCLALGFPARSSCVTDRGPRCNRCADDDKGVCGEPCGFVADARAAGRAEASSPMP